MQQDNAIEISFYSAMPILSLVLVFDICFEESPRLSLAAQYSYHFGHPWTYLERTRFYVAFLL
jgi:hypothetical protein